MKYISILITGLILISCGKQEQKGWSDLNKKEYHSECIEFSKASFDNDTNKASGYCDCVLEKVMTRYPDYSMILRMTPAEKEKYFFICK
ncbi:MAG TPA: hypothetical protein VHP32_11370 [Ignavibacteria bacterium]|nr:hypothetical protein [Ignavibacteria bacterium]